VAYGIQLSISLLTVVLLFLIYWRIKTTEIQSTFSRYSFNIAHSVQFAFANVLLYISLFKLFEVHDVEAIDYVVVLAHIYIFCTNVLLVVKFKDLYYGLFMFIYQLGLTLGEGVRDRAVVMAFTIITGCVIVYSIVNMVRKSDQDHVNEIESTYQKENKETLLP
jgi:hypothetical protein